MIIKLTQLFLLSRDGAIDILNPHPFLFDYNNKTYSLMHNGTIDKTILVTLLTNNNSDSTWINNNPPNTYSNYNWSSDSGWVNVIDSELLLSSFLFFSLRYFLIYFLNHYLYL